MKDCFNSMPSWMVPESDAQRRQYRRMEHLTRRVANVCTGLDDESAENKDLLIESLLTDLQALVDSADGYRTEDAFHRFYAEVVRHCRNPCPTTESREKVLTAKWVLLSAIYSLEKEPLLYRLGYIPLLSKFILLLALFIAAFLLMNSYFRLPEWLALAIKDNHSAILSNSYWPMMILAVPAMFIMTFLLLMRRIALDFRRFLCTLWRKARAYNTVHSCDSVEGKRTT